VGDVDREVSQVKKRGRIKGEIFLTFKNDEVGFRIITGDTASRHRCTGMKLG